MTSFKFSKANILIFICIVLLSFLHTISRASETGAGQTALMGEPGGFDVEYDNCPEYHRITGIRIHHHTVINQIDLSCTMIAGAGSWGPHSHWMGTYSTLPPRPLPRPKTSSKELHCPRGMYIGSVKGASKQYSTYRALSEISFKCYRADDEGLRVQSGSVQKTLRASRGDKQYNWSHCPNNGLVKSIKSRHGWSLDNFIFRCHKGRHRISIPLPQSPSWSHNPIVKSSTVNFRFSRSNLATSYKICIKEKNSSCDIHFKKYTISSVGGNVTIPIVIPKRYHNKNLYWTVMACAKEPGWSAEMCGGWGEEAGFTVKTPAIIYNRKR